MRGSNKRGVAAVVLVVFAFVGCASTRAPRGWVERSDRVQSGFNGAWVQVHLVSPRGSTLGGELIAVSEDTLFLATATLHAIGRENVKSAKLRWYDPDTAGMFGAVVLGTILTVTNGWWLFVTAPIWLIGGSIATATRANEAIVSYPEFGWDYMARFARYPQGIPAVVDRSRIRMTPYQPRRGDREDLNKESGQARPGSNASDTH